MEMISIFFTLVNLSHFTNYTKKCHLSRLAQPEFFRVKLSFVMNGIPKNIMWSSQEYRSNFSSFFTTEDGCELMKYLAIYFKTCNRNNDQKGALSHINGSLVT